MIRVDSSDRETPTAPSLRAAPPDWLLAILLALGLFLWQRSTFPLWTVDLFHIQYAAHCRLHDRPQDIYATVDSLERWREAQAPVAERLGAEGYPNVHLYPPFVAAVFTGVADVPATYWRNVVAAINVLLLPLFALLIACICGHRSRRAFLWALALVLCTYPMARATKLGQMTPLLAFIIWLAVLRLREGRSTAPGVLLGAVGAVKLFPIALLGMPLLVRRHRVWIVGAGTAAVMFAVSIITLGWEIHRVWWHSVGDFRRIVYPFFGNQSSLAWLARLLEGHSPSEFFVPASSTLILLKWACMIGFAVPTLWVLMRCRDHLHGDTLYYGFGLLIAGMMPALPVSWEHYWLFALPVVALAVHEVWQQGDTRFWKLLLAAAVLLFTMKLTRFYGDSLPGLLISGSHTTGMVLLWTWLIRRLYRADSVIAKS